MDRTQHQGEIFQETQSTHKPYGKEPMNKNIKQDSDVNRVIKACAYEETDRVPSFEHYIMRHTMSHILGNKKMEEIVRSKEMLRILYLYTGAGTPDDFTIMGAKITSAVVSMLWKDNLIPWFSFMLPPLNNLELLKATGVDAATPMLTWMPNVRNNNQNGAFDQDGIVQEWDALSMVLYSRRVAKCTIGKGC